MDNDLIAAHDEAGKPVAASSLPDPAEIEDTNDVEGDVAVEADADGVLPGGVTVPEGYHLAATGHFDDQGGTQIQISGLLKDTKIENDVNGVSVSLDRGAVDPSYGQIRVRIIADHQGRAYVFRKDDKAEDTTYLKVAFGHGVL